MTIWLHSTIVATSVAATIAVAFASAAKYEAASAVAPKADMLAIAPETIAIDSYVTVEERADGMSVLARVPADTVTE